MCIHSIPKLGVDKTMFWRLEGWNPIYSGNGKLSPERIFQFPTQSLVSDHFWKSGEVCMYIDTYLYVYLNRHKTYQNIWMLLSPYLFMGWCKMEHTLAQFIELWYVCTILISTLGIQRKLWKWSDILVCFNFGYKNNKN